MRARLHRTIISPVGGLLITGTVGSWAALAPLSPTELEKRSDHIVSGKVVEVTSKTRKSKFENAKGIHRDRIFTLKLRVETVSEGTGVKAGDEIMVEAWQPSLRVPPLPGPQGHAPIPDEGAAVTLYLEGGKEEVFRPLLPNGIVIRKKAGQASEWMRQEQLR